MPTSNTPRTRSTETSNRSSGSMLSEIRSFTLGGFSLPELAVLGAAGYVIWKNRENIETLLEDNGIEVPSILKGDVSNLFQSGVSMLGNREESSASGKTSTASSRRSSSSTSNTGIHDA